MMRKTIKMPTSIQVSLLLLLLVVCFNSSSFAGNSHSLPITTTQYSTHFQPDHQQQSLNDSNINILFLSIVNDLSPDSDRLYFISSFQATQYLLEPGKPFVKITNFDVKDCIMIWDPVPVCAKFYLYDPKVEGDHQKIFWSARKDGVYHSWDEVNWDKRAGWETQSCSWILLTMFPIWIKVHAYCCSSFFPAYFYFFHI